MNALSLLLHRLSNGWLVHWIHRMHMIINKKSFLNVLTKKITLRTLFSHIYNDQSKGQIILGTHIQILLFIFVSANISQVLIHPNKGLNLFLKTLF